LDTLSVSQVVANIAGKACSGRVEGLTLTGNRNTYSIGVKHPVVRALEAFLVSPIPCSATGISNILDGGLDALSILKVIANIATHAGSGSIEGLALIGDGHTGTIGVKNPVVGTLKTFLVLPVPCATAEIRNLLDWSLDTLSVLEVVSSITRKACSSGVKGIALT
jgi:hypothetical protein